jgi:hypothetical protein
MRQPAVACFVALFLLSSPSWANHGKVKMWEGCSSFSSTRKSSY